MKNSDDLKSAGPRSAFTWKSWLWGSILLNCAAAILLGVMITTRYSSRDALLKVLDTTKDEAGAHPASASRFLYNILQGEAAWAGADIYMLGFLLFLVAAAVACAAIFLLRIGSGLSSRLTPERKS